MSFHLEEYFNYMRTLVKQAGDSKVPFLEDSNYTNALIDYLSKYLLLLVIQKRKVKQTDEVLYKSILAWSEKIAKSIVGKDSTLDPLVYYICKSKSCRIEFGLELFK